MIKIFSFVASCAGGEGHTARLSDAFARAIRQRLEAEGETVSYERITGDALKIDFCRSCAGCFKTGVCPLDRGDDMALLKKKILECDILLMGSPVYYGRMSGLMKCVLDRLTYWAHRSELLGKPCLLFMSTHSNHGEEASKDLASLLECMEPSLVNAGAFYANGHPNQYLEKDMAPALSEAAERIVEAVHDPRVTITDFQRAYHLSLVRLNRRAIARAGVVGAELWEDVRVCEERGLTRHVLLSEAIEELCMKPDGFYYRERGRT